MSTQNTPIITGCLVVDVSRHVEPYGILGNDAGMAAYRILAGECEGLSIRLNIGKAKVGLVPFWQALDECNILTAHDISVEGTEPQGVTELLRILHTVAGKRAERIAA